MDKSADRIIGDGACGKTSLLNVFTRGWASHSRGCVNGELITIPAELDTSRKFTSQRFLVRSSFKSEGPF